MIWLRSSPRERVARQQREAAGELDHSEHEQDPAQGDRQATKAVHHPDQMNAAQAAQNTVAQSFSMLMTVQRSLAA
jgi:hypothetical protein